MRKPGDRAVGQFGERDGEIAGPRRDFEHAVAGIEIGRDPPRDALELVQVARRLPRIPGGDKAFHPGAFVRRGRRGDIAIPHFHVPYADFVVRLFSPHLSAALRGAVLHDFVAGSVARTCFFGDVFSAMRGRAAAW
ncbi:MAG: hypothetical protein WBE48_22545 [Xanthobacteraceae bacterium]